MANRPSTNLAMSMRLPATDPYSILHASCWGKSHLEADYIKTLSIDVPTREDLTLVELDEYQVLDFGSKCPILPDKTSKMLVREEYTELWKYVEGDRHNPRRRFGGVVLTGHPGIGKSFGLYFYLFQNLLVAQPIALQTDKNSFFIFVEAGVYLVRFTSNTATYDIQSHLRQLGCTDGMIALVDSSERSPSPAAIFLDPRLSFYIVQATAPRPSRWKDWVEQSSATVLVMKPWSWYEMFIGSTVFINPVPSPADLHDVFEKYGPVPRICFHLVGDEREIHAYDRDVRRKPIDSPPFLRVIETDGFSEAFPHFSSSLLMIPDGRRFPLVRPISQHITQIVASRIPAPDASEIYRILNSEPLTRHLAADFFQSVVSHHIMQGTFSYNQSFGFPSETNITLRSSPITLESIPVALPVHHCYFFNKTEGIHSYDAVVCTSSKGTRTIHLLKVVGDYESPIFLDELDRLEQKFPNVHFGKPGSMSSQLCYWKLVFIVPSPMQTSFATGSFQGVGKYPWENSGYFSQTVVGI